MERLKPFLQAGLGLAYIDKQRPGPDRDGVGLLMDMGFGADYFVSDEVAFGTSFLFDVLPDAVAGEHFFFSWQVLTASFHF